jgi:hypothetical protein
MNPVTDTAPPITKEVTFRMIEIVLGILLTVKDAVPLAPSWSASPDHEALIS